MKLEIEELYQTLSKFIRGRDNPNIILSNQKGNYNKIGIGYQLDSNDKYFKNTYLSKKNHTIFKRNYCGINS